MAKVGQCYNLSIFHFHVAYCYSCLLQTARLLKLRPVKADVVLQTLSAVESHVNDHSYANIADISAIVECIAAIVSAQVRTAHRSVPCIDTYCIDTLCWGEQLGC